jgi:hypothetical protein
MPESEAWRTIARVPRRSGAWSSEIDIVISAWPSAVRSMFSTLPICWPLTCTRLPLTSCEAFWNWALTVYPPVPPPSRSRAASTAAATMATNAVIRAMGALALKLPLVVVWIDPPDPGRENVSVRARIQTPPEAETCGHA